MPTRAARADLPPARLGSGRTLILHPGERHEHWLDLEDPEACGCDHPLQPDARVDASPDAPREPGATGRTGPSGHARCPHTAASARYLHDLGPEATAWRAAVRANRTRASVVPRWTRWDSLYPNTYATRRLRNSRHPTVVAQGLAADERTRALATGAAGWHVPVSAFLATRGGDWWPGQGGGLYRLGLWLSQPHQGEPARAADWMVRSVLRSGRLSRAQAAGTAYGGGSGWPTTLPEHLLDVLVSEDLWHELQPLGVGEAAKATRELTFLQPDTRAALRSVERPRARAEVWVPAMTAILEAVRVLDQQGVLYHPRWNRPIRSTGLRAELLASLARLPLWALSPAEVAQVLATAPRETRLAVVTALGHPLARQLGRQLPTASGFGAEGPPEPAPAPAGRRPIPI